MMRFPLLARLVTIAFSAIIFVAFAMPVVRQAAMIVA